MAATESKFGHLLQPIRDLAANWNVNVAEELEDYLEELESFHFSLEDENGAAGMNFAEAALLIQGSASVYSKKVEYLHSLVYAALEAIAEKRSARQRAAEQEGGDAGGEASDADTEEQFLTLDDVVEGGAEIDLQEGSPAAPPPTVLRPPASLCLLGNCNGPISTAKFQTVTHASGAVLLDPSEALQPLGPQQTRSRLGPQEQAEAAASAADAPDCSHAAADDDEDAFAMDVGCGASPGAAPHGCLSPPPQPPLPAADADGPPGPPTPAAPEEEAWEDPYEPLLPHEQGSLALAPFRLCVPKQRGAAAKERGQAALERLIRVAPLSTTALKEFACYLQAGQAAAAAGRWGQAAAEQPAGPGSPDEGGCEAEWGGYESDGSARCGGEAGEPALDGMASPVLGGWDAPAGGAGEMGDMEALASAALPQYDPAAVREELARRQAAAGRLEACVKAWQASIQPHLDAQDARPAFDIKALGERIVGTLAAEVGQEQWVPFGAVVDAQPAWEVTRLFASMLQLVNAGTLAIAKA